eukprot:scaffold19399_cov117-Skeletonema_dohrnii-CCMP3373.AAC.2
MYFIFVLLVIGLDCGNPNMIAIASSSSSHPLNQYAPSTDSQRHRKRQDLHKFPLESRMVVMM